MRILANDGLDQKAIQFFTKEGIEVVTDKLEGDALLQNVGDFDVLIVRSATTVTKEVLDAAKGIIRAGVGLDNIDVDYATENGFIVKNTPNSSSDSVAELVLGHFLGLARFIGISNVTMRNGEWNKKIYSGRELAGGTLGIIGFGRIGKSLAKKATALGMKVVFYDKFYTNDPVYSYVEFHELLKESDFISVHVPAIGGALISTEEFKLMKNDAFIVNAARGGVIDEEALVVALDNGELGGAGLDVFEVEPKPNQKVIHHPKISVTPHIGAATREAQERIGDEIIEIVMNLKNN